MDAARARSSKWSTPSLSSAVPQVATSGSAMDDRRNITLNTSAHGIIAMHTSRNWLARNGSPLTVPARRPESRTWGRYRGARPRSPQTNCVRRGHDDRISPAAHGMLGTEEGILFNARIHPIGLGTRTTVAKSPASDGQQPLHLDTQPPGPQSMQSFGGDAPMPSALSNCRKAVRSPSSIVG